MRLKHTGSQYFALPFLGSTLGFGVKQQQHLNMSQQVSQYQTPGNRESM